MGARPAQGGTSGYHPALVRSRTFGAILILAGLAAVGCGSTTPAASGGSNAAPPGFHTLREALEQLAGRPWR